MFRAWRIRGIAALLFSIISLVATGQTGGIAYAALGDSGSTGAGAALPTPAYDSNIACGRMTDAYPVLWANAHNLPTSQFSFAACNGATTVKIINNQLGVLSPATTLVTVSAGADDFGAVQALVECDIESDADCIAAWNTLASQFQTQRPGLLDNLYNAIQAAAPNARIVVVGIPAHLNLHLRAEPTFWIQI
jgi:hypothetical protein